MDRSSEAHHRPVVGEAGVDLGAFGALEAAEAEVLDVEAGDDGAVGHRGLESRRGRVLPVEAR